MHFFQVPCVRFLLSSHNIAWCRYCQTLQTTRAIWTTLPNMEIISNWYKYWEPPSSPILCSAYPLIQTSWDDTGIRNYSYYFMWGAITPPCNNGSTDNLCKIYVNKGVPAITLNMKKHATRLDNPTSYVLCISVLNFDNTQWGLVYEVAKP